MLRRSGVEAGGGGTESDEIEGGVWKVLNREPQCPEVL